MWGDSFSEIVVTSGASSQKVRESRVVFCLRLAGMIASQPQMPRSISSNDSGSGGNVRLCDESLGSLRQSFFLKAVGGDPAVFCRDTKDVPLHLSRV